MLVDPSGRSITYLRASVTDRCDFRCLYCMDETAVFLPKPEVLTLEEMDRVCSAFVRQGVRRIRLTGGEPLVRRNVTELIRSLGRHIGTGALDELTLTTNGSRLEDCAAELAGAGVRRINVSLDTLDPAAFERITRWGRLERVLAGIERARAAGLAIKINTVAMKGINDGEFDRLIAWCGERGFDLTLIEVMPLGRAGGPEDRYLPLSAVRAGLAARWTLIDSLHRTGGPARYVTVAETGGRLGFITPLSHTFCESCNRVRLTCTGKLVLCLGQEDSADLRAVVRGGADDAALDEALHAAIARKPPGHDFIANRFGTRPAPIRAMSVTGG
jgi:GTP 3',8-cyclase